MSATDLDFGYAQARLQARHAARPGASEWRHVEATRDLAALLQLTRGNALARWTSGLPARPGVHEIERRLREQWLFAVDEVAAWQPGHWREGTGWMRWLAYLPALQKLARGGRAPAWMREDRLLGPIVARSPLERGAALERTPLAPLAAGFAAPADVAGAWIAHWRTLWPADRAQRATLERLLRTVDATRAHIAASPPESISRDALEELARQLVGWFRRHPLSPNASVACLALLALDVLRLRGALAVRALRDAAAGTP